MNNKQAYQSMPGLCRTSEEVRQRFAGFAFRNLKIKSMRMLGTVSFGQEGCTDDILRIVDKILEKPVDDAYALRWTLALCADETRGVPIHREIRVDFPFISEFEDGATFEVYAKGGSSYVLERDKLGIACKDKDEGSGVDANLFFSNGIGRQVIGLDFKMTKERCAFYVYEPGEAFPEMYIEEFALRLDDGSRIWFGSYFDYFVVRMTDYDGKDAVIPVADVIQSLLAAPHRREAVAAGLRQKLADNLAAAESSAKRSDEYAVQQAAAKPRIQILLARLEQLRDSKQEDAIRADWFHPLVNELYAIHHPYRLDETVRQFVWKADRLHDCHHRLALAITQLKCWLAPAFGTLPEVDGDEAYDEDEEYALVYSPSEQQFSVISVQDYYTRRHRAFTEPERVEPPLWLFSTLRTLAQAESERENWGVELLSRQLEEQEKRND